MGVYLLRKKSNIALLGGKVGYIYMGTWVELNPQLP